MPTLTHSSRYSDTTAALRLASPSRCRKNGDVLAFGEHLKERLATTEWRHAGRIEPHLVANQPESSKKPSASSSNPDRSLAIVLAVSFLSLGWRPGIVVAIAIPWFSPSPSWS